MIRVFAVAVTSLAVAAGMTGCTSTGHAHGTAKESSTRSAGPSVALSGASPSSTHSPAGSAEADPARPLPLPDHQKVLYQTQGRRASVNLAVLPQIPRGTVGIVVLCNGPGRILIHLSSIASFGAACGSGPGVYNEIALGSAKKKVAVSVTGSVKNEWALTMGWTSVIDKPAG
ncbi:hypothetical protein AB0399_34775 [Streptomyces sp. NPDC088194]|uniref:hypothetical protein n=1 Tax=Streptomyces sp. NPDC088194 TaxID=3154931 RepID=UPI00344BE223